MVVANIYLYVKLMRQGLKKKKKKKKKERKKKHVEIQNQPAIYVSVVQIKQRLALKAKCSTKISHLSLTVGTKHPVSCFTLVL